MSVFELVLAFAAATLGASSVGLLLGAMFASSKVSRLYERVERAEDVCRDQARLLNELAQALRLLLDDLAKSRDTGVSPERRQDARRVLERLALAAELRVHLDDPDGAPARPS